VKLNQLVFLDEFGATTNRARTRARGPRGQRVVCKTPHGHWKVLSTIAALTVHGMLGFASFDGATDTPTFLAFVREGLVPHLQPGQVVVLDNLPAHKSPKIDRLIESAGANAFTYLIAMVKAQHNGTTETAEMLALTTPKPLPPPPPPPAPGSLQYTLNYINAYIATGSMSVQGTTLIWDYDHIYNGHTIHYTYQIDLSRNASCDVGLGNKVVIRFLPGSAGFTGTFDGRPSVSGTSYGSYLEILIDTQGNGLKLADVANAFTHLTSLLVVQERNNNQVDPFAKP
jgi:hypothetical protein